MNFQSVKTNKTNFVCFIGWFYGWKALDRLEKGAFPRSYVHVKEAQFIRSGLVKTFEKRFESMKIFIGIRVL